MLIYELYRGTIVIGCCFICVFAVPINKACLQVTVTAVIGGSVLLPCSSSEHDLKPQDVNVHWRYNGMHVYDIVRGEDSLEFQDPRYKNRAERLPDEYLRGNFSIKLNNLTHTDGGKYSCLITRSVELRTVLLIINESTAGNETVGNETAGNETAGKETAGNETVGNETAGKETAGKQSKSTEQKDPEDEPGSGSVETSSSWLFILLIVLISILSIMGCLIVFYCRRKKNQALSFSSVLTEDKTQ